MKYRRSLHQWLLLAGSLLLAGASMANAEHTHQRAGHPGKVRWYAKPTYTRFYSADYVGGGTAFRGDPRMASEGTWGLDYCGWVLPRRIWLRWSHGRRYQGGTGSYQTFRHPDPPILPFLKKL